jgi:uncharacterized protein (TIGR03083 family)
MADSTRPAEVPAALWEEVPNHLAYRASRESITKLMQSHPDGWTLPVPACPGWTVRDVVAHLVGNTRPASRLTFGRTAARSVPEVEELLTEWAETGQRVERLLADRPHGAGPLIMDAFTHESDLRQALGLEPAFDHPAFGHSMELVLNGFAGSIYAYGLPTLRIETAGLSWVAGPGEAVATLSAHPYDLYRSFAGRRTLRQIAELTWSSPSEAWTPAFTWGPFRPPSQAFEGLEGVRTGGVPQ